jgi:hypothetical protein
VAAGVSEPKRTSGDPGVTGVAADRKEAETFQGSLNGWMISPIILAIVSEQDWHRPSRAARGCSMHSFLGWP